MIRSFAVLGKTASGSSNDSTRVQSDSGPGEYTELIQRLFQDDSAVAIIGAASGGDVTCICEGIASELSRLGRRVVVVSVIQLLQASPSALATEPISVPGIGRNVWLWPSPMSRQVEVVKTRNPSAEETWLDSLRRDFDCVLLDCPALDNVPGAAAIAGMAGAAALAVEPARTSRHQVLAVQRTLQLSGVKLAGCILVKRK